MITQEVLTTILAGLGDYRSYPASDARLIALAKAQHADRPPARTKDRGPAYVEDGKIHLYSPPPLSKATRYCVGMSADIAPDEIYDPWIMPSYDPSRYWLFPLVRGESVGGDVPALAVVVSGRCVAIFQRPADHMELAPGRSRPSEAAQRKAMIKTREIVAERWGSSAEVWHVTTDDGYRSAECLHLHRQID